MKTQDKPRKRTAKVYNFNNGGEGIHIRAYNKKQIATHFGANMYQLRDYCGPVGPGWEGEVDVDLTENHDI